MNKSNLFYTIRHLDKCKCPECVQLYNEKLKENMQELDNNYNLNKQYNTDTYINLYLTPGNTFKSDTPIRERIDSIMNGPPIFDEQIADKINSMDYSDFLRTPYWDGVSLYMKRRANFKCSLCNSNQNLNTHHKDYSKHGYEYLKEIALESLCVLCNNCHSKFHNII